MSGKIAIIAALDSELKPLVRDWRRVRERGLTIYESQDAVATAGGIGSAPAAMAAMVLVAREQPACLMSVGLAGALRLDLHVGDVLLPAAVINGVTGRRFAAIGGESTLLSGKVIAGPEEKRKLRLRFHADALDMEAAGVATVAESCGLPFVAVKAISDELDFDLPPLMAFVDTEGRFRTGKFVLAMLSRPAWWKQVWELLGNSRKASRALAKQVEARVPELWKQLQRQGVTQPQHAVSSTERN